MSLLAAFAPLLLSVAAPNAAPCNPIPGWEQVLADESKRIIVVGEMHGTNETPALFADAVCLTAQARRLVVAVEQPAIDQAAIDAFMASDGGEEARKAFLSARMWNGQMKDGRSSEAIFRLFENLRKMHAAGAIQSVIAFQPWGLREGFSRADYEKAMAEMVLSSTDGGATVIALVGDAHSRLTEVTFGGEAYKPMAAQLPADQVVTLFVLYTQGEAWICQADGCGPKPSVDLTGGRARGLELGAAGRGMYSGVVYLGVPLTASPPQTAPGG